MYLVQFRILKCLVTILEQLSLKLRTLALVSGTYAHHGIDFRVVSVLLYHMGGKSKVEMGDPVGFVIYFFLLEWRVFGCRGRLHVLIRTNVGSLRSSVRVIQMNFGAFEVQNSYRVVRFVSDEKMFVNWQQHSGFVFVSHIVRHLDRAYYLLPSDISIIEWLERYGLTPPNLRSVIFFKG